jgi:hypothetical protein
MMTGLERQGDWMEALMNVGLYERESGRCGQLWQFGLTGFCSAVRREFVPRKMSICIDIRTHNEPPDSFQLFLPAVRL